MYMHVSSLNFQGTRTKDSYLVYETFDHFYQMHPFQMLPWCIVVFFENFLLFWNLVDRFFLDLLVAIL